MTDCRDLSEGFDPAVAESAKRLRRNGKRQRSSTETRPAQDIRKAAATLKNLDIFEGRQGNIEERQYSSKYAIMESVAAFVADFVPAHA
jgi:hypothetical protein